MNEPITPPSLSGLRRQLHIIWLTIAIPATLVGAGAIWFWREYADHDAAKTLVIFLFLLVFIAIPVIFGVLRVNRIFRVLQESETQLYTRNQQLITADRLASVGTMAASIAHEVNNPLTTIKILIHSLKEQVPATEAARDDLEIIQGEIDKISTLVLRLMQFARPTEPELALADLNVTLSRVIDLIRPKAQLSGIVVHEHCRPVPPVLADPAQLGQVFLNLLLNAVDATPQGGTIKVISGTENNDVVVTIWNSGKGIDPALYDRIFDPFFTTKATGTGLGLSIAHMIMAKHNGTIRAIGHNESGTTFRITLPRALTAKS
ncbi:MAG TPA: ATP-binding protein [bacterium]|nr:ATP-binding protein [bacterium]